MGAYEEANSLQDQVITVPEKADYSYTPKKQNSLLKKYKGWNLIVSLLTNIVLIIALIIIITVSTKCSTSGDVNNKESEKNGGCSLPGNSTDEVTETKNQNSAPCEDDWIWHQGKCYYFSTTHGTWMNSERFCKLHDASLALIDNQEELDFLFRYKGSENHWIGLRRTNDNKAWIWTNGTLYNESLFTIQRSSSENIEHVILNRNTVKSVEETILYRWICSKT